MAQIWLIQNPNTNNLEIQIRDQCDCVICGVPLTTTEASDLVLLIASSIESLNQRKQSIKIHETSPLDRRRM